MRVIKFRAWHRGNMTYNHSYNLNIGGQVYFLDTTGEWEQDEIKEVILMQFTGLFDKNGKEIYEGDICSTYNIDEPSNLNDLVVFDDGSFVFQCDYKLSAELRGFKTDYIEVIGNIYENPELLK